MARILEAEVTHKQVERLIAERSEKFLEKNPGLRHQKLFMQMAKLTEILGECSHEIRMQHSYHLWRTALNEDLADLIIAAQQIMLGTDLRVEDNG